MTGDNDEEGENPRLWKVDPSNFTPLPKETNIRQRLAGPLKTFGIAVLICLAMAYPVILLTLGILYGGLVFWGSFAGSAVVIYLVVSRMGYARNFAGWGSSWKRLIGILMGFPLAAGFYLSLVYLRLLALPLVVAVIGMGAIVLFRNASSKT